MDVWKDVCKLVGKRYGDLGPVVSFDYDERIFSISFGPSMLIDNCSIECDLRAGGRVKRT